MTGSPQVIADLQNALSIETRIQLQYHLDCVLLKDMELDGWAAHADKWGEGSECIVKEISKNLVCFLQTPNYQSGAPVAQSDPPAVIAAWLVLESGVYAAYNQAYANALDAGDSETAHDFHEYLEAHRKRIRWIERKQRQIGNFGAKDYMLEALG